MSSPEDQSRGNETHEASTFELYKTAFARLNFQDEYLFKFSTVFLTAHGALAVLAGSAYFQKTPSEFGALAILAAVGVVLALAWALWTHHNDYWHSVWIGVLRDIEVNHLRTSARVFALRKGKFARPGKTQPILRGHRIAQIVPIGVGLAWGVVLVVAICRGFAGHVA